MPEFSASPGKITQTTSKSSTTDCLRYTVDANGGAIINSVLLFNTTGQDQLVQLYIKDSSDGAATVQTDEQIFEQTIKAKQTFIFKGPIVLGDGDKFGIKSVSDDVFNVWLFGAELI